MKNRWIVFLLVLSLAGTLLFALMISLDTVTAGEPEQTDSMASLGASAAPAELLDLLSIDGSSITSRNCYNAGETQTLCFTVNNASVDGEWLDEVRLTFPNAPGLGPWNASCYAQDPTDASGYQVNLTCQSSPPNELLYVDLDNEMPNYGEISNGASWMFCVDLSIPGTYFAPRMIPWGLSGDETGGTTPPHELSGEIQMEQCRPLELQPLAMSVEGCNGINQLHTIDLWNNTGSNGTFDITYHVPDQNASFSGPSSFTLSDDSVVTFTVSLAPNVLLQAGDQVTVTLNASGLGQSEDTVITQDIVDFAGWQSKKNTPAPSMDSVVVWASHADGGLWAIGGHGSQGAIQRYDGASDTWSVHASEAVITPTIDYPSDGCYGLNGQGEEIVVLFPDTLVTDTLHVYNITQDAWSSEPLPIGYPVEGRWAQDIVSLLNFPNDIPGYDKNVCYLSGGADQPGGGTTRDLWAYQPASNTVAYLGHFPAAVWFNFHASWYVPWVGNDGAICIAGGVDHNHQINNTTQCYDLESGSFNGLNADLGPLPEPWWAMADGWQISDGNYQIWLANGVSQDGRLLPASAYADSTTGGFVSGPDLPIGLYRLEGDGFNGQFFTVQGAQGGFLYTANNQLLTQCPNPLGFLPLIRRE